MRYLKSGLPARNRQSGLFSRVQKVYKAQPSGRALPPFASNLPGPSSIPHDIHVFTYRNCG